ncbi:hypothetical protein AALO_G00151050 [Alosa alosa]|uniref:Uncharacterized protein n=1 Tax=Alosa alosa TaxID=278164 RepID=A0AAV6GJ93_9TELE|nr:hypothetical protein AALO_G00151050 [Alosa alosa]
MSEMMTMNLCLKKIARKTDGSIAYLYIGLWSNGQKFPREEDKTYRESISISTNTRPSVLKLEDVSPVMVALLIAPRL